MEGHEGKKEPTSGIKRTWGFLLVLLLVVMGIITIINMKLIYNGTQKNSVIIKISIAAFVAISAYVIFAITWSHKFAIIFFICIIIIGIGFYFFLNSKFQNPEIEKIQNLTNSAVNFINR